MGRIRVLVVDDSALVRKVVTESLAREPDIEVVGTAIDPYVARERIPLLNPDVVTLDLEMPRMDGITFLKLIMKHRPMPVVVMSSLTSTGSEKALEALQAGAVEVIAKPSGSYSVVDGRVLAESIRAAANSRLSRLSRQSSATRFFGRLEAGERTPSAAPPGRASAPATFAPARPKPAPGAPGRQYGARALILLGASTGGTEALKSVLVRCPADLPPMVIVQHIPAYFSKAFADRLNHLCQLEVREAAAGDRLKAGLVLVAPGGRHVVLRWTGSGYAVDLNDGPPVHHQRPAVDVLFESAVKAAVGPQAMAMLFTGMGSDGAAGMVRLRQAGVHTVAQNEESCVVFGMPREAIRQGGAAEILHLDQFAARLDRFGNEIALRPLASAAASA